MSKHFNVRVYGLWFRDGDVLVSEEQIRGQKVIKFPGGGLEWGEGTIDGLKREWKEELGTDINVLQHFYTTDFFQQSAWDQTQVISIYYFVEPVQPIDLPYSNGEEQFYFLSAKQELVDLISLPIDKAVAKQLQLITSL